MIAPTLLRQIESDDLSAERVVAILDLASRYWMNGDRTCSVPDDHIDPRRHALFMARSILREVRDGGRAC